MFLVLPMIYSLLVNPGQYRLDNTNSPAPYYRFNVIAQKASELCQEVKSLGSTLLSALEKRDAEGLSLLRSEHELQLLRAVRYVRKSQILEARTTRNSLEDAKEIALTRQTSYQARIDETPIPEEKDALDMRELARTQEIYAAESDREAKMNALLESASVSVSWGGMGGPGGSVSKHFGGFLSTYAQFIAAALRSQAMSLSKQGEMASIKAQQQRQIEEWQYQVNMAKIEMSQIEKQIAAADIRIQIAEKELSNHEQQMENAKAVDDYLRSKYTNEELYGWMVGQISDVYFQSYQLAYDTAKGAERAYRFELGLDDSNYIQFGYWDNLKKGLLAGERLSLDLKRLESSYLEKNKREYEITRHISLVLHDPASLIKLKETGVCEVEIPETFFDTDYPGQYFRRIKSASLTLPCIVGPYTSINCTLTLLSSRIRIKPIIKGSGADAYLENLDSEDSRFLYDFAPLQSIATSHGQNDSGLFELNFRDERYLPFEGAGAISRWRIELPKENNAFDLDSISDVILKLNYTAREGGALLREKARESLETLIAPVSSEDDRKLEPPLQRLFMVRHEFANQWHKFLHGADNPPLELQLDKERFPYLFRGRDIRIVKITLYLQTKKKLDENETINPDPFKFMLESPEGTQYPIPGPNSDEPTFLVWNQPWKVKNSSIWEAVVSCNEENEEKVGLWKLLSTTATADELHNAIDDLAVLVEYIVTKGS